MTMQLGAFETDARVFKFDPGPARAGQPSPFDYAYLRIGRVKRHYDRETGEGMIGVLYDRRDKNGNVGGGNAIIQYPEDTLFRYAAYE
jgi:hypothetical protein